MYWSGSWFLTIRNTSVINLELRFKTRDASDVQDMLKVSSKEAEKSTQQTPRSLPPSAASLKKANRYSRILFHGNNLQGVCAQLSFRAGAYGFISASQTIIFVLIFLIFFWGCLPLSQAKNS